MPWSCEDRRDALSSEAAAGRPIIIIIIITITCALGISRAGTAAAGQSVVGGLHVRTCAWMPHGVGSIGEGSGRRPSQSVISSGHQRTASQQYKVPCTAQNAMRAASMGPPFPPEPYCVMYGDATTLDGMMDLYCAAHAMSSSTMTLVVCSSTAQQAEM